MSEKITTPKLAGANGEDQAIFDLSILSEYERFNLLSVIFDDVCDTNNDLYLRLLVFVNPVFALKELNYFIDLLQKRLDYCNVRIAENKTFTDYYPDVLKLCESTISKLSLLKAPQEQEEQVDCDVTFYYDNGTLYSRVFSCSGKNIVFNLHQNYIDLGHDTAIVFNVFNLPNADKICTIHVSLNDDLPF